MNKYFTYSLIIFLLTLFSCKENLDIINEVDIHGIILKIPKGYTFESISPDSSEFMIKKSEENVLHVNSSIGTGNFINIFNSNSNSYIEIVDSINKTFKYIYKNESNGEIDYFLAIGQQIEPLKLEPLNNFDCHLIDTNDVLGKIQFEECIANKLLIQSMESKIQDVNIYLEISTKSNSFVMSNKKENLDLLIKSFDEIKIPKKFN